MIEWNVGWEGVQSARTDRGIWTRCLKQIDSTTPNLASGWHPSYQKMYIQLTFFVSRRQLFEFNWYTWTTKTISSFTSSSWRRTAAVSKKHLLWKLKTIVRLASASFRFSVGCIWYKFISLRLRLALEGRVGKRCDADATKRQHLHWNDFWESH